MFTIERPGRDGINGTKIDFNVHAK
jgi:hypothetical protein